LLDEVIDSIGPTSDQTFLTQLFEDHLSRHLYVAVEHLDDVMQVIKLVHVYMYSANVCMSPDVMPSFFMAKKRSRSA